MNFDLEYLKRLQIFEPFHTKMPPTFCFFGTRFIKNPSLLLAVALLFDEKIRQSTALFWFGLRYVGILQMFYSRAVLQRTIKDCGLCPYNPSAEEVGGLDGFLYEAAHNFEVFSNI